MKIKKANSINLLINIHNEEEEEDEEEEKEEEHFELIPNT